MVSNEKRWKILFLACLGLAIGAAFCMKWMEPDFEAGGEKFNIMGLELFYPKEKVEAILAALDDRVGTILSYHLHFDFAFMAGIFPGIAAACMMARERTSKKGIKKLLFLLASLQLLAWALDITENLYLLHWMKQPGIGSIGKTDFAFFHTAVAVKWIIALAGLLMAVFFFLRKRKRPS